MNNISKSNFVSSAFWKMLEAFSTKGVSIIISIVLARLLLPENYGIVGITDVLVNFSVILVQSGINTSLIRKEKVDDLDYSNAFFFCLAIATVCYGAFFAFAPSIALFYEEPLVSNVLRIQMLSLFLCALSTVRNAIIVREFKFKQLCLINLVANIVAGIVGIYIAIKGGGVWALVIYTLTRDGLSAFLLFFFVKWKLMFRISSSKLKILVSFSIWVLVATLLDFFGNNIYNILIGKYFTMADLGYFNKGYQLPQIICLYVFGAITSVLLPTMAQAQNDIARLKRITRKVTRTSAYIIFPMMTGLATVGDRLVPFLFSEKWVPCVPIYCAACVIYAVNPCRSINIQLLYAKGKSSSVMIIEMMRFLLLILGLVIGVKLLGVSVEILAYIQAGIAIINTSITHIFIRKLIDYNFFEWLKDQSWPMIISVLMGIIVYLLGRLPIRNNFACLLIQITVGMVLYVTTSALSKNPEFIEIRNMVSEKLGRKK